MSRLLLIALFACALCAGVAFAEDAKVDENEMFSDTASVTTAKGLVDSAHMKDVTEKKTTSIGGQVTAYGIGSANRGWFNTYHADSTSFASVLVGVFELDARLLDNVKVFGNCEVDYMPTNSMQGSSPYMANDSEPAVNLRELFFDANIGKQVYFRAGKQVLQWGRCLLWNPTDLVNVEQVPFISKIGEREGAYGVRIHAPFGTKWNAYSFIDLKNAARVDEIAVTGKLEMLLSGTEMAFSAWGKENHPPVVGYDFSTQAGNVNFYGECSIANGNNSLRLKQTGDSLYVDNYYYTGWTPKISLGMNRFFDFFDIHDGISVGAEFFYNGAGYTDNIFADKNKYRYNAPVTIPGTNTVVLGGSKSLFLVGNNLYDVNYHSCYYAALFTGISRFILSDLSLNVNGIANISQSCGEIMASVGYTTLSNLTLSAMIVGYCGHADAEYTFINHGMDVRLSASVAF